MVKRQPAAASNNEAVCVGRCCAHTLDLEVTLTTGQCFTWRAVGDSALTRSVTPVGAVFRGLLGDVLVDLVVGAPVDETAKAARAVPTGDVCSACTASVQTWLWARVVGSSVASTPTTSDDVRRQVVAYLQLDVPLLPLWRAWADDTRHGAVSKGSRKTAAATAVHPLRALLRSNAATWAAHREDAAGRQACLPFGFRLLRQRPYDTLMCFVCSQNNHVKRITAMIDGLCRAYGTAIHDAGGAVVGHTFPTVAQLARASDDALRAAGFGYRAKYVVAIVAALGAEPPARGTPAASAEARWAARLRAMSTSDARSALLSLHGIGRKVADCVLLFGFARDDLVPVDTHVAQIAAQACAECAMFDRVAAYHDADVCSVIHTTAAAAKAVAAAGKKTRNDASSAKPKLPSLTPHVHTMFQQLFTDVFGPASGWAHSFLFATRVSTASVVAAARGDSVASRGTASPAETPQRARIGAKRSRSS